jgi:hypothetical protein
MGALAMTCDFVTETWGPLRYSDSVWEEELKKDEIKVEIAKTSEERVRRAGSVINPSKEGYYEHQRFLKDIAKASDIVSKNSGGEYKAVFMLDNSPIHNKKAEDSLNAKAMNVNEGGKQPKMRNGSFVKDGIQVQLKSLK